MFRFLVSYIQIAGTTFNETRTQITPDQFLPKMINLFILDPENVVKHDRNSKQKFKNVDTFMDVIKE